MQKSNTQRQFSGPDFISKEVPEKKSILPKVFIGFFLGLIITIFSSLYFNMWDPLWNPFRMSTDDVFFNMQDEMTKLETFQVKGDSFLGIDSNLEFAVNFTGKFNLLDSKNNLNFKVLASLPPQGQFLWETKTINTQNVSYTNFDIPIYLHSFLYFQDIDVGKINNRWIEISEKEEDPVQYFPKALLKQQDKIIQKIGDFIKKEIFFVEKEFSDKRIKGEDVYHYELGIREEKVKNILNEISDIINKKTLEEFSLKEDIDLILENIKKININIWIGKDNYHIYRLRLEMETLNRKEQDIKSRINLDFYNFNQKISEFKIPEETLLLEEIIF